MKLAHTGYFSLFFGGTILFFVVWGMGWEVAGVFSCLDTSLNLDSVLSKGLSLGEMKLFWFYTGVPTRECNVNVLDFNNSKWQLPFKGTRQPEFRQNALSCLNGWWTGRGLTWTLPMSNSLMPFIIYVENAGYHLKYLSLMSKIRWWKYPSLKDTVILWRIEKSGCFMHKSLKECDTRGLVL